MELLEEILNRENMNQAYKSVFRNKGTAGVDGVKVEELNIRIDKLEKLKDEEPK